MESERKLVTIRKIDDIIPHGNADALEVAVIGGWNIIVQKNTYKRDDFVVYFEIDSMIPVVADFEFLRKYCYTCKNWMKDIMPNGECFRIKSLRLRGVISQGLIIPISESLMYELSEGNLDWEDDLSEFYKVKKYDPPETSTGDLNSGRKGNFPAFILKTKQERVQNVSRNELTKAFETKELFEPTRKYHGSSITVYAVNDPNIGLLQKLFSKIKEFLGFDVVPTLKLGVCSHNVELDICNTDNSFVQTAFNTQLVNAAKVYCETYKKQYAFQGELCGPNIQDNHHAYTDKTIVLFDIFDIEKQVYLDPIARADVCVTLIRNYGFLGEHAKLEFGFMPLPSDDPHVLVKLSEFKLANGKENEGIVWKSLDRDFSFKAVSNEFLLNEK